MRPLSQSEYESIEQQLEAAQQNLDNREEALRQAFDAIESQMCLLGATGVEDQLQDYVQETLESLKAAGMKVISKLYLMSVITFYGFVLHRFGSWPEIS